MFAKHWFENNYMKLSAGKCRVIVSGYKHEEVWVNVENDLMLFLEWRTCFLSVKEGYFLKLLWSLNLNTAQLFGCFIVDVPTAKLIGYMREPLELFMITLSQLLIHYLPWMNLSVFTIKISRGS